MTQTNDPPLVASVALIPDSDEKADLDAPSDEAGKLVTSQAPNITITSTTVVADQAERLALDVQEGDIAIQQDTTESFIFTGGSNELANWQLVQFDAVGGIAGEDIAPRDIDGRNVVVTDIETESLNGASLSNASSGDVLTSDGGGNASFSSPPGLPSGAIVMWGGNINNIPSGFSLCDGTNGTPDLTDKFVQGAGAALSQNETGGTSTDTVNININDNVSVSGQTGAMQFQGPDVVVRQSTSSNPGNFGFDGFKLSTPSYPFGTQIRTRELAGTSGDRSVSPLRGSFSGSGNVNASDSDTVNTEPPFLALAYIQKD